jgi:hypothetical protein
VSTSGQETGKAPADPQTRLAFRTWMLDRETLHVRSLNAPAGRKPTWIAKAMASPEGNWPHDTPLIAACPLPPRRKKADDEDDPPEHGQVPAKDCSCGIYATTDLDIINGYLRKSSPVLGVVELGGRVIPASQGYRAAYARLAVILLVDDALTEPHRLLRKLADAYKVPCVVPHSADAADYREIAGLPTVAAEAEAWLRQIQDGTS